MSWVEPALLWLGLAVPPVMVSPVASADRMVTPMAIAAPRAPTAPVATKPRRADVVRRACCSRLVLWSVMRQTICHEAVLLLCSNWRVRMAAGEAIPTSRGETSASSQNAQGERVGVAWALLLPPNDPGYGFLDESTPEISLWVRGDSRGQGVGRILLGRIQQEAIDRGIARLSLLFWAQCETWVPGAAASPIVGPRWVFALQAIGCCVALLWRRSRPLTAALVVSGLLLAPSPWGWSAQFLAQVLMVVVGWALGVGWQSRTRCTTLLRVYRIR